MWLDDIDNKKEILNAYEFDIIDIILYICLIAVLYMFYEIVMQEFLKNY